MNKFLGLESKDRYVNYTIKNYVECYDDLNADSIQTLTELFASFKTHQLSIGNILVDKKPLQGVKLTLIKDRPTRRNSDDLVEQLTFLGNEINLSEKKETLFYQSISHLCNAVQYLGTGELAELNVLFQNIHNYKQSLNDAIENNSSVFYPYNRYPKRK